MQDGNAWFPEVDGNNKVTVPVSVGAPFQTLEVGVRQQTRVSVGSLRPLVAMRETWFQILISVRKLSQISW